MGIITIKTMDIKAAVDYATNEILLGTVGFFVNSEFGYIPVEVTHTKPTFDMRQTCSWDRAPVTKWVMNNRSSDYEWYVRIHYIRGMDPILLRLQLIREFSGIMYKSLNCYGTSADQPLVNALVRAYFISFHPSDDRFTEAKFMRAYINTHAGIASKISSSTHRTIKSELSKRLSAEGIISQLVKEKLMNKFDELEFREGDFGNDFYDLMAAAAMANCDNLRSKYDSLNKGITSISAYDLIKRVMEVEISGLED